MGWCICLMLFLERGTLTHRYVLFFGNAANEEILPFFFFGTRS